MLSHGAEGRSSGNLKYPLKQQKAHSLVLTQIIQPGTRSRKTESEGEKSLSPPPRSGTVRLHVSYFTPPETRCNFPSPFQQSLVNTLCGETRASPAFPAAGRERGSRGAGRTLAAHLVGAGAGAPADKSGTLRTGPLLLLLLLLLFSRDRKRSSRRGGSCC